MRGGRRQGRLQGIWPEPWEDAIALTTVMRAGFEGRVTNLTVPSESEMQVERVVHGGCR